MQQYAPTFPLASTKVRRRFWVGSLIFGLLAIGSVVLVLALDGGSGTVDRPAVVQQGSGGASATARPDESATAAAVGSAYRSAPVITLRRQPLTIPVRPDESKVASAISQRPAPPAPAKSITDLRTGP
jgi:hypothetical protein